MSGTDQRVRLRIGRSAVRPRPGYRVWGPNAPCTRRSARGVRQQGSWWVYHWGRRWSTRRTMTATASIVVEVMGAWQRTCRPRMHQASSQKQPVDHPSYADHEVDKCHHSHLGAQVTTSATGRCAPAVKAPGVPAGMRELAACSMAIAVMPPAQCTPFPSTTPARMPTTTASRAR